MANQIAVSPELSGNIERLEAWAKAVVVRNPLERTAAIDTVKQVKTWSKAVTDFFADSKAKAHAAWKAVVASEKTFTDRLEIVERAAKRAVLAYDQAEEEKRMAEQRKLQAEADEKARKERERLEKEAAKLKTPEKREERLAQAAAVVAPVVTVAPMAEKQKGESTRKVWKHRVTDAAKVQREWLIVNDTALAAFARATKGAQQVPGVEFFEESQLAIGGR